MRRVSPLALFVAATLAVAPAVASAHSRLLYPTPRNTNDGNKDAVAPCGGARSTNVTVAKAGGLLRVTWEETIDHPGHYELLFSMANDTGFTFLANGGGVMQNNITDVQVNGTANPLPHRYQAMVKLPDTPCDTCTLQMKQFMSNTNTYYYSCSDIKLVPANADLGAGVVDPVVDMGTGGASSDDGGTDVPADPGSDPASGGGGGGDPVGGGGTPVQSSGGGCSVAGGGEATGNLAWPLIGVLLVAGLRPSRRRR